MELTRRHTLTALMASLAASVTAGAQGTPNAPTFAQDLPDLTMKNWEVTAREITLAPASVGAPHRHPGFVLVYVLEGQVVAKVSGSPEATYGPGQMFYEHPGSTHEVSRNASTTMPARFLALIFAEKGLPATSPA
jgi:quercetin dioxygenase-like cupin family protein